MIRRIPTSHHWRRCTILRNDVEPLVLLWLSLTHSSHLILILVTVPLICKGLLLVFISLRSVVHFNSPSKNCLSLHLLKSAFRLFLHTEFDKSITFRNSCYWVTYDFGLVNTWIDLLKSLHEEYVVDTWLKITNVDLVTFIWTWLTAMLVKHVLLLTSPLESCLSGCSSRHTASMRGPVEFEILVGSRDFLTVKRQEHISCSLPVWELHETIAHRCSSFVSDQFYIGHCSNLIKLCSNVLLVHPWLHIANPKCF